MIKKILKLIPIFLLIYCSISLLFFNLWLQRYFGDVDFDLILVNINFGFHGLINADDYVINKFIEYCFYGSLFLSLIILVIKYLILKNKLFDFYVYIINITLLILILVFNLNKLDFFDSFNEKEDNKFIENNYIKPNLDKKIADSDQKDVIIIYLESFEENYTKNKFFEPKIMNQLNFNEYNFSKTPNFLETKYNNYTIGGIVSSQCGVPQKPIGIFDTRSIYKKDKLKHERNVYGINKFLPKAICLGDILKYNDYENILIYSGHTSFHAMDIFFKSHGYNKIIDYDYFKNFKNIPKQSWSNGVNDSVIFKKAIEEVDKYKSSKKKFNITILTTDTHFPGYIDPNCKNKFISEDQLINSIHCTASSVYDFTNEIKNKYGDSISIILLGDHLYPIDDRYNNHKKTLAVNKDSKRTIYAKILSKKEISNRSKMNHYDFFPTILQSMNLDYGDRLGLGYSIFKTNNNFDYEIYYNSLVQNINKESEFYYDFWR
tara:strand:+ start:1732 stop:3201 length:1470 start_codon:yes stop_codon:yes gene_type:complete